MLNEFILIFLTFLFIVYYKRGSQFPKNIPPGPLRIPGFGNLFQLATIQQESPFEGLHKFSKKYGPITFLQVGVIHQIVIEEYDLIKQVFTNEVWVDRVYSDWIARRSFGKVLGILTSSGEVWKEMRKFSVKTLRDFGFGKQKSMEMSLQEELTELTQRLENRLSKEGHGVIDMNQFFTVSILNVLWHMIAGYRFCHDDVKLRKLLLIIQNEIQANALGSLRSPLFLFTAFPFLAYLAPFSSLHYAQNETLKDVQTFLREILEERRAKGFYLEEQRDYIDVFLCEIDAHKNDPAETNFYTDEQFIMVTMDLVITGSETTNNSVEFAMLYLIKHQDVQRRIQKEIGQVVGHNRSPCISDAPNMPYTEATVLEVQRCANVVPIVLRASTRETELGGYTIPKKTIATINLHAMHMNKKTWGDPLNFRPDRFLNSEQTQVINSDKILPFGAGKRECIGKQFTKATLFTFITTMLQKFSFEESPEHPLPSNKPVLGFTLSPNPYSSLIKFNLHKN